MTGVGGNGVRLLGSVGRSLGVKPPGKLDCDDVRADPNNDSFGRTKKETMSARIGEWGNIVPPAGFLCLPCTLTPGCPSPAS